MMEDTDQRMSGMFDLDPGPPPAPPQPVGIYGWRKRCLYASVLVLLISVVLNLALTIWILRVLNFPLDGMGTLQVNPSGFSLRGEAEFLKTVYVEKLQSEREKPLYILSDNKVQLTTSDKNGTENSQFVIDENSIEATCDIFHVKDLNNKTQMLLNGSKVTLGFPDVGFPGSLTIKDSVKVPSVFGHDGKPLVIRAKKNKVLISAFNGVSVEGHHGDVNLRAAEGINIKSSKGPLRFDSTEIVLTGLPKTKLSSNSSVHQLCLCYNGALFLDDPAGNCEDSSGVCAGSKP